ncbi:MAG: hypothetical protein OEL89_04795 [Candidatus Peregrinibacteria bacterium]|nr:hypothetical protein [Candidatus Peregrinibacteria bacterium]
MKKLFQKFGLNDKETDTFLKLLELGSQPASVLAKNLEIPRPTVYLILENLQKKSLVEVFPKFDVKYFRTVSPKDLFAVLERQKLEISKTEKILEESLPALESLKNKLSITPKVRFFETAKEIEKIYDTVLKEKSEFRATFNPYFVKKFMPKYFNLIAETLKNNKIPARELLIDCSEAREYFEKFNSKNHQIKILPKRINFPSDTIISGDKIFMIAYNDDEKQISATEILSPPLAQTQKMIFDELWEKD